jgi:hypothetical protein
MFDERLCTLIIGRVQSSLRATSLPILALFGHKKEKMGEVY